MIRFFKVLWLRHLLRYHRGEIASYAQNIEQEEYAMKYHAQQGRRVAWELIQLQGLTQRDCDEEAKA